VILIGSDVLIQHLRGNTAAQDWLAHARRSSGPLAISVVSLTEIAGGMPSLERRQLRDHRRRQNASRPQSIAEE
jgi:predicted nucleic acid-binding protein